LTGCPWRGKTPQKPPIAHAEPAEAIADQAPASDAEEARGEQYEAPPLVVPINTSNTRVCVRDAGAPDGDVISASFNGAFIFDNLELTRQLECFEVHAIPDIDNILLIHAISDGKIKDNTVLINIINGETERTFYVRTSQGRVKEIRFRIDR
jgi:hypothetical protein